MLKFRNGVETPTLKVTGGTPAANKVLTSDGSGNATWAADATKTWWVAHNFIISGEIKVPSGQTDLIPPAYFAVATNQTLKLAKVRYNIEAGTSVTFKLQKNSADITGFTGLSATTTTASTDPADVTIADNDEVQVVVTAVAGTPQNMTVMLTMEYAI